MAIRVIEESTRHDGVRGVVCLESDISGPDFSKAIAELQGLEAKNEAIKVAASKGLPDPRIEMTSFPYAVDANGEMVTRPREQQVYRYRIDIPVTRRLV